jgi:redox-sensing transcriptional repressor
MFLLNTLIGCPRSISPIQENYNWEQAMKKREIPDIIVSRLPVYLRALRRMQAQEQQNTSSQELGEQVGISAAQIRKDLSQFGEFGKQGTGYNIVFLIGKLCEILHVEHVWDVTLVGMGDMGHALARYQGFHDRGFRVTMVFDNDPSKVGEQVGKFVARWDRPFGRPVSRWQWCVSRPQ